MTEIKNIIKLFTDPFFRDILDTQIEEINSKIREINSKNSDNYLFVKRLKRSPVDRLSESRNWNVEGLIKVYSEYYILRTVHYPMAVRSLVSSMILSAASQTAAHYKSLSSQKKQ